MADNSEVFSVTFDSTAFVDGVNDAIKATEKLEASTDGLTQSLTTAAGKASKVSFSKPISELNSLGQTMRQFRDEAGKLDLSKVNKALDDFGANIPEVEKLLESLKAELSNMTEADEGFAELTAAVKKTEQGLKTLKGETDKTGNQFVPLKKRLKDAKLEMQALEDAGEENSARYIELRQQAAELTDQIGDQAEAVRALSSDTFALDATVDVAKNVAAGFQLVAGAQALLGGESEETQKTMQRLLAVMSVVNGLQEVQAFLTGQSAGKLALQTFWSNALAVSQRVLGVATATATTAMRGLATALAATGIGAIVVAVGFLIDALISWADETEETERANVELNNTLETQNKILDDNLITLKRRADVALAAAKAQGKTEEELFDLKKGLSQEEVALLKADYESKYKLLLDNLTNERVTEETKQKLRDEFLDAERAWLDAQSKLRVDQLDEDARRRQKDIDLTEAYLKKLQELRNKVLTEQEKAGGLTDAEIKARYDRQYDVEAAEIRKQYKGLGDEKVSALLGQLKKVYDIQASEEIEKSTEAREKATAEILKGLNDEYIKIAGERAALIKDDYERSTAEIEAQQREQETQVLNNLESFKANINKSLSEGLIDETTATNAIRDAASNAEATLEVIRQKAAQSQLEAERKRLNNQLDELKVFAERSQDQLTLQSSEEALIEARRYADGLISYEQYEANILALKDKYGRLKLEKDIQGYQAQLDALEQQLAGESDEKVKADIEGRIVTIKTELNNAFSELETFGAGLTQGGGPFDSILSSLFGIDPEDPTSGKKLEGIKQAITKTFFSIISLARTANQAEISGIDRAMAKQKEKVEAAKKLAEDGNAEYLKLEEERLRELEAQREKAAKRQLQIDAALQASQILTAVAGAAAQIAKGGPVNVLAGVASIVAAIASGASLVRQIQQSQPRFYEGTDYVSRGKNPVGRDTIPAMLHEGEAVISADTNKRYAPTIQAIRRGLLPDGVVNKFVRDYTAGVRYDNVAGAVETAAKNPAMDEMNARLKRLEGVMGDVGAALKAMNVKVNMDKDGFSASISSYMNRRNKAYRA